MSYFPRFNNFGNINREDENIKLDDGVDNLIGVLDKEIANAAPLILVALSGLLLSILIGTLFYQQVVRGSRNFLLAERNRIRLERTPAPRGIIFDSQGRPLVRNVASYELVVNPGDLPSTNADRLEIMQTLSGLLNVTKEDIEQKIKQGQKFSQTVVLAQNINQDDALRYQTMFAQAPGVKVDKIPERVYLSEYGLAHAVGYVSKPDQEFLDSHPDYDSRELVGKTNIEKVYESFLHGKDGVRKVEIDSTGRLQRVLTTTLPTQGNNVVLGIDLELQKVIFTAIKEAMASSGSTKAAAIAINPKNGEVLSLVSLPDYDNNAFVQGRAQDIFSAPGQPLINRAIAGVYPSGSTIKPLWAAAAIEQNVINEGFKIDTPEAIQIGEFTFPDWKDHGLTDIKTAIAESNNIFFYGLTGGWGQIKGIGITKLVEYMKKFDFDQKTGIDLTGEGSGFIPTPEWKKKTRKEPWYIGDTYHLGIGQGEIGVTPLELLIAHSAIHNGGKLIIPHLAVSINDENGNEIDKIDPPAKTEVLFNDHARQVAREGMRQGVTSGSSRALNDLKDKTGQPVQSAAKTGTAQFGNDGKTHAWFVAFAPYDDPQIGIIVIVEGGGEGHATALPVAKKGLEWWFGH